MFARVVNPEEPSPAPGLEREPNPLAGTAYRAIRVLGKGGMGEVFLAEHVQLQKRVVIKLLHESLVAFPKHVDRIRIEAEALGRLHHPSIVEVRDFASTPDGRPFIVMERLLGATLHQELRQRGTLGAHESVSYTRQVLSALAAAHALGIVHRDIKLDNIFIHHPPGAAPVAKLLDFGIAKVLDGVSARAPKPLIPTDEGVIVGTPRYVSPEAALGKPIDHRADIYSVGLVLYTVLCGRGPWDEEKREGDLIVAQATKKPDPPSMHARQPIPTELEQIVMRALEKEPADRFQSALEFAAALEAFSKTLPAPREAQQATDGVSLERSAKPSLAKDGGFEVAAAVPALQGAGAASSPATDVHATVIDEPLDVQARFSTDVPVRIDAAARPQSSDDTLEIREAHSVTEVLPPDPEAPPDSTRTATTPVRRDATELIRLEAKLRRPLRDELALHKKRVAGVALASLVLLGWLVFRLLSG